jgi:hypothetical protein
MVRVKVFDRFGCPVPAEQTAIDLGLIRFFGHQTKGGYDRRDGEGAKASSCDPARLNDDGEASGLIYGLIVRWTEADDGLGGAGPKQIRVQTLRSTLSKQLSGLAVKDRLRAKAVIVRDAVKLLPASERAAYLRRLDALVSVAIPTGSSKLERILPRTAFATRCLAITRSED